MTALATFVERNSPVHRLPAGAKLAALVAALRLASDQAAEPAGAVSQRGWPRRQWRRRGHGEES